MSSLYSIVLILLAINFTIISCINIPPEANYNFTQIAASLNYPTETHYITTKDGYILTYFRLQAKNTQIKSNLPVVLIQHGLLDSADSFILNTEDQCPGFILANQGYDVWFGNNRGNGYSLGHITQGAYNSSNSNSPYWDFSWQEMTFFDLPASFEYINKLTGKNISYMGHSEGGTIMVAALARRDPTILSILEKFIALAPAVFVQHSTSPLVEIGYYLEVGVILKEVYYLLNDKKFGHRSQTNIKFSEDLCALWLPICIERVKLISDANPTLDNTSRFVITTGHFPSGSSVQNVLYWEQMFGAKSGTFSMYDYGKALNQQIYNSTTPPDYDLSQIKEDIYIFAGIYDELVPLTDIATLRSKLTGVDKLVYNAYPLGHGSFVWGKDVATYMNDVLAALKA